MKRLFVLLFFIVGSYSINVLAHGEDRPGPHRGYIRMPGAFHTEVVQSSMNQFKVYLLDLQWKNPSVKNSTLEVKLSGKKILNADCKIIEDYYMCELPASVDLSKTGELKVLAQREDQKGMEVSYRLPLKFEAVKNNSNTH